MDERLIEIFKLVFLLNQKGKGLRLSINNYYVNIIDSDCKEIIPHWTGNIYLNEFWEDDYNDMVNGTLEMLKGMLEGEANE